MADTILFGVMWIKNMKTNEKILLAQLANSANKRGLCVLRNKTLMELTGLSEASIRRALRCLQDEGYIQVVPRRAPDGTRIANLYVVNEINRDQKAEVIPFPTDQCDPYPPVTVIGHKKLPI